MEIHLGVKKTESWDGTSWTEVAEINTSRIYSGVLELKAALGFFGENGPTWN